MSKIEFNQVSYSNFGPFVLKTKLPNYIVKKLKTEGKKAKKLQS